MNENLPVSDTSHLVDGKYGIADLVDMDSLRKLFERFGQATGLTIGFLDHPAMNILIAVNWRDICTRFHRSCAVSEASCIKSNRRLLDALVSPEQTVIERCDNGLVDCAVPIVIGGKHIASLATGQLLLEPPDIDRFRKQSREFGFDEKSYLAALAEVDVVDEKRLREATAFLGEMAQMISEMGYARLKQKQESEVKEKAETALRESEARARAMINAIPDMVFRLNRQGIFLDYKADTNALHYQSGTFIGKQHREVLPPEFVELLDREVQATLDSGTVRTFEYCLPTPGRGLVNFEARMTPSGTDEVIALVRDITVQKRAEDALMHSQATYRGILDSLDEAVYVQDETGTFIDVNHGAEMMYGYTREEMIGGSPDMVEAEGRNDLQKVMEQFGMALAGTPQSFEFWGKRKDGSVFPKEVHLYPGTYFGKKVVIAIAEDITEHKQVEESLRRSKAETERLLVESDRMRRNALSMLEDQQRADKAVRRLLDEASEREFFLHQSQQVGQIGGWRADPVSNEVVWTEGVYEIVEMPMDYKPDLETGLDFYLPDSRVQVVENLQRTLATGEPFDIQVQVRGAKSGQEKWTELRGQVHRNAAGDIDYVMGTLQDITARKLTEQALQASEQRFKAIIQSSPTPLALNNEQGEITYLNPAFEATFGYTQEDIPTLADWWLRAYPDADYRKWVGETWQAHMEQAKHRGMAFEPIEIKVQAKDGSTHVVIASAATIEASYSGEYLVTLFDVTERELAEEALRQSEELMRTILDNVDAYIYLKDGAGRYLFANRSVRELWHAELADVIGSGDEKFFDAATAANIFANDRKVLEGGETVHIEEANTISETGRTATFLTTKLPLHRDDGGIYALCGISTDITERKCMEAAMQQQLVYSHALNRISRTLVELGELDCILDDTVLVIGETLGADRALIYDIDLRKEQIIGLSEWLNPQHSDLQPTKGTYPLSLFSGGAREMQRSHAWFSSQHNCVNPSLQEDGSGELLHGQMQIKSLLWYPFSFRDDGFYLLVLNQVYAEKAWSGAEIEFLDSVSQLVSVELERISLMEERQRVEIDLRIAAIAFESQEGMLITDVQGNILRVNHAFTEITGYTAEEVLGKNPSMFKSGRQDKTFYRTMWETILAAGSWEGEIWNRRKNGEIYPEHLTITAVKNEQGAITNYVAALSDITRSKIAEEEIKSLAFFDPLTGLPNRRLLQDRLQQALTSAGRSGKEGALLFIDLDNFKALNDTLGHDIGDMLLEQVAQRLIACVREGDTVARLGGDEFVVILEDLSTQNLEAAEQTETVAEKILVGLNLPYQLGANEHHSTPSIGATLFGDHQKLSIENLLKQADIAMYQAKRAGRNTLRFFDPQMQDIINTRASLEIDLRNALEKRQFQLYYQLQTDQTRRPLGAEALLRLKHPERGIVSPAQFIPLAEESGLILPIGLWVLDTACAQLKAWQGQPHTRGLKLAVNVSASQFHQSDFIEQVRAAVRRHGIDPRLLKLELTESMLQSDVEQTIATMNAMRAIGIHFSLDDFGTGYSSLQYLKQLPIDQLKIDQSFVRDIETDSSDLTIVHTIIAMAQSLGLEVIAEGVETENQHRLLQDKGCMQYQGYLFGKPVPIELFEMQLTQGG
ncbi:MAG: PAS domain S-box protein [Gallionella sp.]|jgi:diguanylate cyclase (GGDEF)-like protein/PAS domain S-box-containing protein